MVESSGNASGKINLYGQIDRDWDKDFVFDQEDENGNVTAATDVNVVTDSWEFFVKRYKGDREKIISRTSPASGGISVVVYTTDTLTVHIPYTMCRVEEGEYYFELLNLTRMKTKVSGKFFFSYDPHE